MSHIKLITSGKGGAGKSTISVYTAGALVRRGKRVLLLEMDAGLRGLDLMLGVSDRTVFDLGDVLMNRVEPVNAIVGCSYLPELHLLSASTDHNFIAQQKDLEELCRKLSEHYDYLIIDSPAGLGIGFDVSAAIADSVVLVATPDPVSVRDAAGTVQLLSGRPIPDTKLIINRLPEKPSLLLVPDLDTVIDQIGVQLIGVIPEDVEIARSCAEGRPLSPDSLAAREFDAIAARMEGCYVPLSIR